MVVNGRRILEIQGHWKPGDVLQARFLVWQRHHILQILLGMSQEESHDEVEHTSFLQRKMQHLSHAHGGADVIQDSFTEICTFFQNDAIEARQEDHIVHETVHHGRDDLLDKSVDLRGSGANVDPTWCKDLDSHTNQSLNTLNVALAKLCLPGWVGLNHDMTVLSDLHPHAQLAGKLTVQDPHAMGTFHVFTDGSCRKGDAGWAFAVICAQQLEGFVRHIRVGFAAGKLSCDLGPTEMTAQDAEATAIVAACEYILSRREVQSLHIHLHFGATAVGFGSMGATNVVKQDPSVSKRQQAARILVSLVQRSNSRFRGCHVHAHKGHPWNELVDSLAKQAAGGWSPNIPAQLRSADLLAHLIAEWAWLQICPDSELPCLEQIMRNEPPEACKARTDSTLILNGGDEESCRHAALHFASINVGTLHQDQMMPNASVTYKAAELMHQFAEANLHFVGVQETRARTSCSKQFGSFTCLVSAGMHGQAGVELWVNEQAVSEALGFQFRVDRDLGFGMPHHVFWQPHAILGISPSTFWLLTHPKEAMQRRSFLLGGRTLRRW